MAIDKESSITFFLILKQLFKVAKIPIPLPSSITVEHALSPKQFQKATFFHKKQSTRIYTT